MTIGRLFAKVFLWFWSTVLARLLSFWLAAWLALGWLHRRMTASFAPRIAEEAAHAYESGGAQEFEQFERGLVVAPIQGIQSAARMVAAGDLSVRASVEISTRHDELAALAADFDVMVERMSAFVERLTVRFNSTHRHALGESAYN